MGKRGGVFGKFVLLLVVSVFMVGVASAVGTPVQIYWDDFEDYSDGIGDADFQSNWTNNPDNDYVVTTIKEDEPGARDVEVDNTDGEESLTHGAVYNLSQYDSCTLTSRVHIEGGYDSGEHLCMDYSNDGGSNWNMDSGGDGGVGGLCQDGNIDTENVYRTISYEVSNTTGVEQFNFRFRTLVSAGNEDAYIDKVNLTCINNNVPVISNITLSGDNFQGNDVLVVYANTSSNGVNDSDSDSLEIVCDTSNQPTIGNTDCTDGVLLDSSYEYDLTCSFPVTTVEGSHSVFCRIYDGEKYSTFVSNSYDVDSGAPITSIMSIAGDSSASYFDTENDGITSVIISGEEGMLCRWSSSDVAYSLMVNDCNVTGNSANCSMNNVASEGFVNRHVSCKDTFENEQNSSNNLDVNFFLDYTAPTTSDNSNANIQVPPYIVTINENDNVDSDPLTQYCIDISNTCIPSITIDDGGIITFTSTNRGVNYLRYNSTDDAGNNQSLQSSTININQLPIFTGANDDSVIIKGGTVVNVSTISFELDSQQLTLLVCDSTNVTYDGCGGTEYCSSTGDANVSCTFTSKNNSDTHIWYAYIFDDSDEAAITNPKSGSYITDSSSPIITLSSPINESIITQSSVTVGIVVNEPLISAWYSLDNGINNVSMTNSSLLIYSHQNTSIANGDYNLTIWANDSYGNIANLVGNSFVIDDTAGDTTHPTITIISPVNNTYYTTADTLFNITTDESLDWAGYILNNASLALMGNVSTTNWNITVSLSEQRNNITFYANDSSSNNNQANKTIFIYTDLNNPSVDNLSCANTNDSENVTCVIEFSDAVGLDYYILSHNASGAYINSSHIDISGTSNLTNYIIESDDHTPAGLDVRVYTYDLSGRLNDSLSDIVFITDDTVPIITNITYVPNSSDDLDPNVRINISANITDDYSLGSVLLQYKENDSEYSNFTMSNVSDIYSGNFTPNNTNNWTFRIYVVDSAGNVKISENITLGIENDTSEEMSTTIPTIKSILTADAVSNNSLGNLIMENIGEGALDFNVTLTGDSELTGRFSVNYTGNSSYDYVSINEGELVNITIDVNATGLNDSLYAYNVTVVSSLYTTVFEKYILIQESAGAVLSNSIETYSSTVTRGQTDLELVTEVTNLGTLDATGIWINWTLPSEFTLVSGSLSRYISVLSIDGTATNTITVSVAGDATSSSVNLSSVATSDNADSSSDSKSIAISDPLSVSSGDGSSGGSSGGSGGVAGGSAAIVYSKEVEIVRGTGEFFEIEVANDYYNSTLKDLTIILTGFPEQYFEITPSTLSEVAYGEVGIFTVDLLAPSYKSYEEHTLRALITGMRRQGTSNINYVETQNILLRIQEVSRNDTISLLEAAKNAVLSMRDKGLNVDNVELLLSQAETKLNSYRNKESYDFSMEILSIEEKAYMANSLLRNVGEALSEPRKLSLLLGNVVADFEEIDLAGLILQESVFATKEISNLLKLALVAYDRGDYESAYDRAVQAKELLIFERRSNPIVFLYLYWHYVLVALLVIAFVSVIVLRGVRRSTIAQKINDINKKEELIEDDLRVIQNEYFKGKMSVSDYNRKLATFNSTLARIRKERVRLRNKRIRFVRPEQILKDLTREKHQLERDVRKYQRKYYKYGKMTKSQYNTFFKALSERLAEVEDERSTVSLKDKKRVLIKKRTRRTKK